MVEQEGIITLALVGGMSGGSLVGTCADKVFVVRLTKCWDRGYREIFGACETYKDCSE